MPVHGATGWMPSVGGRGFFLKDSKIELPIILSWILLHRIVQNFACNILTLRDNIDKGYYIIFDGVA